MGLRQEMAQLLRSMIEENAPDARQVAKVNNHASLYCIHRSISGI